MDRTPTDRSHTTAPGSEVREALSLLTRRHDLPTNRLADLTWLAAYARAHVGRAAIAFGCMVAVAAAGAVAPLLMMDIVDRLLPGQHAGPFHLMIAALVGLQMVRLAGSFFASYHVTVLGQAVQAALREDLFRRVVRLPLAFFEKRDTGYVVARMSEVSSISLFFSQALLAPLIGIVEFALSLAMMCRISLPLTIVCLLLLPLFYLVSRFQGRGIHTAPDR